MSSMLMCRFLDSQVPNFAVAIVIYMALATEILVRYSLRSPVRDPTGTSPWASTSVDVMDTRLKLMISGLGMITIFLLIRCVHICTSWLSAFIPHPF